MSAIQTLEARLRTHPEDAENWLVYADWLSDQGDVRGRLIALEHQLSCLPWPSPERMALEREIEALNQAHRKQWLGGWSLRSSIMALEWQHGFVRGVELRGHWAIPALEQLLTLPAARLLATVRCSGLTDRWIEGLARLLPGTGIHTLGVRGASLDAADLQALAPAFQELSTLELHDADIDEEGAETLAGMESLAGLRSLDLHDNALGDRGTAALVHSPLRGLVQLKLGSNGIGPRGVEILARCEAMASLSSLSLGFNEIGARGAAALASSPVLGQLSSLELWANDLGVAGARELAGSRTLRGLTALALGSNDLGVQGLAALLSSEVVAGLSLLEVGGNDLGDAGAATLAGAERLRRLTSLELGYNAIGDKGATALAGATILGELASLDLAGNRIRARGAVALARSAALGRLTSLTLSGNPLGEKARKVLTELGSRIKVAL